MKKQTQNTLLIVGGAGILAYLIFAKKPTTTAIAPQTTSVIPQNLLTQGLNLLKNILPPSSNSPQAQLQQASNPSSISPIDMSSAAPSPAENIQTISPITAAPIDISALQTDTSGSSLEDQTLAGFAEIPGTALAVMCGCAACMAPPKAIGKFDWTELIVPAAIIGGGYFLLKKVGVFSNANSQNNSAIDAQTAAANAAAISVAKSSGINQTVSQAQLNSLAIDIYNKGVASDVDQDGIVNDVIQVNTLVDLLALKQAFGTKQANAGSWLSTCSLIGLNCQAYDMDSFLKAVLDSSHINTINGYLSAQNINYQF